ncbi:MAG: radical SAM protein [Dehalococcoidales bacterium]|nr:radical SAM protein [Dehalococcoidales bacterium]
MNISTEPVTFKEYVSIRNDFVLKNDDGRIIVYSLSPFDSSHYTIQPLDGFALSLLDGKRKFSEIEDEFRQFFPDAEISLTEIVTEVDNLVRGDPSLINIKGEGLLEQSDRPITHSITYNPKEFIVSVEKFREIMADIRTRTRLSTPLTIMTFFTDRCQTDCIYCYVDKTYGPEMPMTRWRELIREMKELDIMQVGLDGGEPLARPDGLEFLEELIGNDMVFLLSTKARFTKEHVSRLMDAGFRNKVRNYIERNVQLSIDAWDDKLIERITGSSVFKKNIIDTFDNFMEAGVEPRIKSVILPMNADQPLKVVEFFYPRGARQFRFSQYFRSFYRHSEDFFMKENSRRVFLEQLEEIHSRYPDADIQDDFSGGVITDPDTPRTTADKEKAWARRAGCAGGWTMLGVAPGGGAILCEMMLHREPYLLGDLNTQSLMEVWNSRKLLDFIYPPRDKFKGTVCYDCPDFETCHWEKGYCYRDAYFSYGTIYEAPPNCPRQNKPGIRVT